MPFPLLPRLAEWAPVELNGLGILTILGDKSIRNSIGNLVHSWADWMPTFGSFVVADNQVTQSELGFAAHNITEVSTTPYISSWFTRWLNSFLLTHSATFIQVRLEDNSITWRSTAPAMALGFMTMAPLLVFATIIGDAWGTINVLAMICSVLVRQLLVNNMRSLLNDATSSIIQEGFGSEFVKVLLVLPNSKIVTIVGPRILIIKCMLLDTRTECSYRLKAASWAAFGVHAIALGMSSFLIQMLSLLVLGLGTFLTTTNAGANREVIGSKLRLKVDDGVPTLTRVQAYARLGMGTAEENAMMHWGVIPHDTNRSWWDKYQETQKTVDPLH